MDAGVAAAGCWAWGRPQAERCVGGLAPIMVVPGDVDASTGPAPHTQLQDVVATFLQIGLQRRPRQAMALLCLTWDRTEETEGERASVEEQFNACE